MATATETPVVEQHKPAPFDGVAYLKKNLARQPGDFLKITKVGPTSYRVNWFASESVRGDLEGLRVNKIRKSEYIDIVGEGDNAVITVRERQ